MLNWIGGFRIQGACTLHWLCWNAMHLVIRGGKYADFGNCDWRISYSWCTCSLAMHSVGCCNDGGRIPAMCMFDADALRGLKQLRTRKGASNPTLFLVLVSFTSRWSSPRGTVHRGLFSRGDYSGFLGFVSFTSRWISISSRGSSQWAVLKGRLQFLLVFVSCISRWSSRREWGVVFSRGYFNFFSPSVHVLLARQFTVDCSLGETSIFFSSCLSFCIEILLARQFTVDCSQGETSIFFSSSCL